MKPLSLIYLQNRVPCFKNRAGIENTNRRDYLNQRVGFTFNTRNISVVIFVVTFYIMCLEIYFTILIILIPILC